MKKILLLATFALLIGGATIAYFQQRVNYPHQFAVCTMFKNEEKYIKQWIDYHHKVLGASKFYLYDNDSTDNYREVIQGYIDNGLVEVIPWETSEEHALRGWYDDAVAFVDYQLGAFNHCLKHKALGNVRWLGIFDIDEFIVPTHGADSFQKLLNKRDNPWPFRTLGAYHIHWKVFGTSGIWDLDEKENMLERLTMRAFDDHGMNRRQVKSIYRPEAIDICKVHYAAKHYKRYDRKKTLKTSDFNLNHYMLGTQKRFIEKRGVKPEDLEKLEAPFNMVEDKIILQYMDKLKG